MGTNSRAAIVAIAAIPFYLNSSEESTIDNFYRNVSLQSSLDIGLCVDAGTIEFWMSQDKDAQQHLQDPPPRMIETVLEDFTSWYLQLAVQYKNVYIWGNGSTFDITTLQSAYEALGWPVPWKYNHVMDVRTLVYLNPAIKDQTVFEGVRHNALDDCRHQINYCRRIRNSISVSYDFPQTDYWIDENGTTIRFYGLYSQRET